MVNNHVAYSLSELDLRMVRSVPPGGNWKNIPKNIPSKRLEQIRASGGRTTLYGRLEWGKPSYTITTYFNRPGNGTYIHPDYDRVITAREAARLQSFPDDFVFLGSKGSLCVQIGNAVPPVMAFSVAKQIKAKTKAKNIIDLFAGAGGLSKGFEWAGFNVVAANDNFKEACDTFRLNHPKTKMVEGDITKSETKKALYNAVGKTKIDIVAGGPPCQGFSHAGKRFIDDPRNFMFKEFVEVAKKISPSIVLMENVEGILTINQGKTFEDIKASFKKLGYNLAGRKIHAVEYGVPQRRKRMILIGVKKGNPEALFPEPILKDEHSYMTVNDAISNLTDVGAGDNLININLKLKTPYQRLMAGLISPEEFIKKDLRRA